MPMTFDEADAPLMRVVMFGAQSDEDYKFYCRQLLAWLSEARVRNRPIGLLIDAPECEPPNASQRRMVVDFIGENEALFARNCLGMGIVTPKPVQRGILTAVLWVRPMPMPTVGVSTAREAEHWLRNRMAAQKRLDANAT